MHANIGTTHATVGPSADSSLGVSRVPPQLPPQLPRIPRSCSQFPARQDFAAKSRSAGRSG
eukprot:1451772-Amphidinium_carterae.1